MKKEIMLPDHLVKKLQNLPESGMGYQVVNFKMKNGKIFKNITVLNSSVASLEEDVNVSEIVDIELFEKRY